MPGYPRPVLAAVLFDVDFTLSRPGPELGPEGYRRIGERHGLALDPAVRERRARSAIETLQQNHELVHDEEIWIAFTEQIVLRMGGDPRRRSRLRDRAGARVGAARELLALRGRGAGARGAASARLEDRARSRTASVISTSSSTTTRWMSTRSSARGRTAVSKPHASIFVAALRAARRRAGRGGDGRRLVRGRHRGCSGARDPGDPARSRRAHASDAPRPRSTRCSRCPRGPRAEPVLEPELAAPGVGVRAEGHALRRVRRAELGRRLLAGRRPVRRKRPRRRRAEPRPRADGRRSPPSSSARPPGPRRTGARRGPGAREARRAARRTWARARRR